MGLPSTFLLYSKGYVDNKGLSPTIDSSDGIGSVMLIEILVLLSSSTLI